MTSMIRVSLTLIAVLGSIFYLLVLAIDPREAVRARNALNFTTGPVENFDWVPNSPPPDFRWVNGHTSSRLKREAANLSSLGIEDPIDFSKAVSQHLLAVKLNSHAIQADVESTYERILAGTGYCADFTIVFTALAQANAHGVREWGMSFDGFSGNGHAFNEIYSNGHNKWVFIDSFYGFYTQDSNSGVPLSYLELVDRLNQGERDSNIQLIRLTDNKFAFKSDAEAIDYYRRGSRLSFMVLANDVVQADTSWQVKALRIMPLPLEQFLGIAFGVYPQIKIMETSKNRAEIDNLESLKWKIVVAIAAIILGFAYLFYHFAWYLITSIRRRR